MALSYRNSSEIILDQPQSDTPPQITKARMQSIDL